MFLWFNLVVTMLTVLEQPTEDGLHPMVDLRELVEEENHVVCQA